MKIKSVSGFACFVKNLDKTVKFYEALGFEVRKREANRATLYSNWFWMDFLAIAKNERTVYAKEAKAPAKGGGFFMYLSVDDVDAFYKQVLSKAIKPKTQPQDQPWGNREFLVRDPDGYNLVIFKRK